MQKLSTGSILLLLCLILLSVPLCAQQITGQREELNSLKARISALKSEIAGTESEEKKNFSLLEKYNEQAFLTEKLIAGLQQQVAAEDRRIAEIGLQIEELEQQSSELKKQYAAFVTAVYKGFERDELTYLLSAESLRQAVFRYKYFEEFSRSGKETQQQLMEMQQALAASRAEIEERKAEKASLIAQREAELRDYERLAAEKKSVIASIRESRRAKEAELEAKEKARASIEQLIARLIAEEEARRRAAAREAAARETGDSEGESAVPAVEYNPLPSTENLASFAGLKGRMGWPVATGSIIRRFGENKNAKLKTVTLNYGVDIAVRSAEPVRAVAQGVVSAITWIPGYGTIIILNHKGEYRTVYGHLGQVSVTEGQVVNSADVVGHVAESLDGYVLHFEIWQKRKNINPEIWLAKK